MSSVVNPRKSRGAGKNDKKEQEQEPKSKHHCNSAFFKFLLVAGCAAAGIVLIQRPDNNRLVQWAFWIGSWLILTASLLSYWLFRRYGYALLHDDVAIAALAKMTTRLQTSARDSAGQIESMRSRITFGIPLTMGFVVLMGSVGLVLLTYGHEPGTSTGVFIFVAAGVVIVFLLATHTKQEAAETLVLLRLEKQFANKQLGDERNSNSV